MDLLFLFACAAGVLFCVYYTVLRHAGHKEPARGAVRGLAYSVTAGAVVLLCCLLWVGMGTSDRVDGLNAAWDLYR